MDWFSGSIPDAVLEVKNSQKVLLVFVMGEDEYSNRMMQTYNDHNVSNVLNINNCVALKLVPNTVPYQQFCQIYPVVVIPSSFFIGKNGLPIEIITGSLEPSALIEKVNTILQLNRESSVEKSSASSGEPMDGVESDISVENGSELSASTSTNPDVTIDTGTSVAEEITSNEQPESNVSLEEKVQRAKQLIEATRQNKAQEEEEKERTSEQKRREIGKAMQKAKQTKQENELKEWAQNVAKEKEEERLARERVRAQIAQDRAERAARYHQVKANEAAAQREKDAALQKEEQEKAAHEAALRSTMARLQFRLPDGSSVTHTFSADATLGDARTFLLHEIAKTLPNFVLCSMFPRRQFTENNYAETLRDLELAPSAAILVLPAQATAVSVVSGGSFFGNVLWMLFSPFLVVWKALSTFVFGGRPRIPTNRPPEPTTTEPAAEQPGPSGAQVPSTTAKKRPSEKDESTGSGKASKRKEQKFYREGNVFRINNRPNDDDDNNTWNGNSTQQM